MGKLVDHLYGNLPPNEREKLERQLKQKDSLSREFDKIKKIHDLARDLRQPEVRPEITARLNELARSSVAASSRQNEWEKFWSRIFARPIVPLTSAFATLSLVGIVSYIALHTTRPPSSIPQPDMPVVSKVEPPKNSAATGFVEAPPAVDEQPQKESPTEQELARNQQPTTSHNHTRGRVEKGPAPAKRNIISGDRAMPAERSAAMTEEENDEQSAGSAHTFASAGADKARKMEDSPTASAPPAPAADRAEATAEYKQSKSSEWLERARQSAAIGSCDRALTYFTLALHEGTTPAEIRRYIKPCKKLLQKEKNTFSELYKIVFSR